MEIRRKMHGGSSRIERRGTAGRQFFIGQISSTETEKSTYG